MKKLIIFLLLIGVLSFNIYTLNVLNVYAENSTEEGTGETGGTGNGEEENPVEEEDTTLKSDATIKNVVIAGEKIVCEKNVCEKIVIDNDTKSVKITYELTNSKALAERDGKRIDGVINFDIKEGENKFDIKVTSEDKTKTNTYTFKITKKVLSTDSTLKKLSVNGTEVNLVENETKYTTSVSYTTKKLEIEAIPNDEKAKIIDFKNNKTSLDFFEKSKEVKIKVQSEAGDMVTYTLTVNKRSEADVTLKSLVIKNHTIEFDKEITDYELKVLKNVSQLDIEAKPTDSKASVKITNPKLTVGENEIKIEVSNDGNTNTYIIKVTKLDEDDKTLAELKSLTIENYEIDFEPSKYEYDLKIENENYLSIKAIAKMKDADVEITGNLDLENGSIIKIKVTYDDEYSNTYKINIEKEGSFIGIKNKVSKKAVVSVIAFDILSMITIGIVQLMGKKKNKIGPKNPDLIKKNSKKIEKNDSDDIDII